jgi:hypothetical protein
MLDLVRNKSKGTLAMVQMHLDSYIIVDKVIHLQIVVVRCSLYLLFCFFTQSHVAVRGGSIAMARD